MKSKWIGVIVLLLAGNNNCYISFYDSWLYQNTSTFDVYFQGSYWRWVSNGSSNGLVRLGKKPLPKSTLIKINGASLLLWPNVLKVEMRQTTSTTQDDMENTITVSHILYCSDRINVT